MEEEFTARRVRAAYDAAAETYAATFGDDLADLPLDREVLDVAVAAAPEDGWVIEAGCGPAPAAAHLAATTGGRGERPSDARGRPVLGFDLSGTMLAVAGRRVPGLRRIQADLRGLPLASGSGALVIAFYTVQHVARPELRGVLAELARVLRPGGVLALATHLGEGDVRIDRFLDHDVEPMAGALHDRDELVALLAAVGLTVAREWRRGALPHEHPTERLYLLARSATRSSIARPAR